MANALEILKGGSDLTTSSRYQKSLDRTRKSAGGGGDHKRVSIRGKVFRVMHGSEQVHTFKDGRMDIVIIDTSPVLRTYYDKDYNPKADAPVFPACWSNDGVAPDDRVPAAARQCKTCAKCDMNIKGSARSGQGKACRYSMNLAFYFNNKWDDVYLMSVPAMSLFGKADGNDYPLQAYLKTLAAHQTPVQAVVTQVTFDTDAEGPKLFFTPTERLDVDTFDMVDEKAEDPAIAQMLELNFQPKAEDTDDEPKAATTARRKTAVVQDDEDEDDIPFEEPKKRGGRKTAAVVDTSAEDELDEW